jgi:hypothetical protein
MTHLHFHNEESIRNYFAEQLLTILVCGLFGYAAIQMYRNDMLGFLTEPFRFPVLLGGIGILILVLVRAISVWREAGKLQGLIHVQTTGCSGDHIHTDACNHSIGHLHNESDHTAEDHLHANELSWVFARMLILIFPVLLFFMGLPNSTFSMDYQLALAYDKNDTALGAELLKELAKDIDPTKTKLLSPLPDGSTVRQIVTKTGLTLKEITPASGGEPRYEQIVGEGTRMKFNDLKGAAFDTNKRESLQGQTVILEGRFKRLGDKEFSLFRFKMACCAADATPLKVRIVVPQALSNYNDGDWVEIKGQVQFRRPPGQDYYIPVIMVGDINDIRKKQPLNEYED